jgi:hypothetical protein
MNTLEEFHAKEFKDTNIIQFWIVKNSLDIIFKLPEKVIDMYSSDIDLMYQKMSRYDVFKSIAEEIQRAATIAGADSFFIVVGDTAIGNKIDQGFWYNTESGTDPTDGYIPKTKDKCSKGVIYPIQHICNILAFLVHNSYVTLGNSVHHQVNGIPQGGHSSAFLANLTCHSHE